MLQVRRPSAKVEPEKDVGRGSETGSNTRTLPEIQQGPTPHGSGPCYFQLL